MKRSNSTLGALNNFTSLLESFLRWIRVPLVFFFFFFGVNFVVLLLGTISLQDISGFESSPLLQGIKKKKLHNKLHNFKFQARSYLYFSF